MELEYKTEIALEILQKQIAKLINTKQNSYERFKKELKVIKGKQAEVYLLNENIIDEVINSYKKSKRGN